LAVINRWLTLTTPITVDTGIREHFPAQIPTQWLVKQIVKEMGMSEPLLESNLQIGPVRRGKVRDVYDLGDSLLLVTTDRISAFDWVMFNGIPDKGRVLTQLSAWWFNMLQEPNHLLSLDLPTNLPANVHRHDYEGRTMHVRKTEVVPVECVVRGYLEGSGWKEYQNQGTVCGITLPPGLKQCSQLPEPIFSPATKEENGHDQNITFERMCEIVGSATAEELRRRSLAVYQRGAAHAATHGIIIADTKFEWGWHEGKLILIDEVLTPDSSRFWPATEYEPGRSQRSFDKQFLREWLEQSGWDKNSPPPPLPEHVIANTRLKYIEAYECITGKQFL
jgi:phosphoribosylaminoimidazole-succinocarboxamide synthase